MPSVAIEADISSVSFQHSITVNLEDIDTYMGRIEVCSRPPLVPFVVR